MAEKEFTLKVIKSEPTPRRRRVVPGANGDAMNRVSTGSQVSGSGNAGSSQGDGHVHANKGALDKIGVTDDGYVTITDMPDAETVTEKAKAGYADTAGTADEAKTLTADSEVWEMFVSRLKDDIVKGNITFEKAIAVAGLATLAGGLKIGSYGIDKSGKATLAEVAAAIVKATSAEAKTLKVTQAADLILSVLKSSDFVSGAAGKGVAIQKKGDSWSMEIDELLVRKIATFLKLEIRELSYVGGNIVLSKAGNEITKVEKVSGGWKCSFTSNEGDEVQNFWKAGDQARCQKFDVAEGTNESVQSKYYWRLVTEVGEDYVVLSETDYDTGVTNSEPAAGDKIVQMGFRLSGDEGDKDRTSLIILSTSGENTPSIEAYTGVVGYALAAEKRLFILSPGEVSFRSDLFRWTSGGVKFPQEVYRGGWESGTAYNYYDKVTHNGSTWICIATEGTSSEPAKGNAAWKEYAEKGATGAPGSSVTVSSTTITYAKHTNGTTPPTSGWSEAVPAVPAGQYLWSKTVVKYSDGKSTTTYTVARSGTNGTPGTSVTVKSTSVKYAVTASASQPADSAFTNDKIPALTPGQYLWSMTVVTYSDGKSTKSYAVSRIGTDGSKGEPGTDGKTSYTHFAYASSADGKTGFSKTYFNGALYIGTCSDFNEEDPDSYTAYTWARLKGETGAGYSPNMLLGSKSMSDWRFGTDNKDRVKWSVVNDEETGHCVKQTVTADGTVNGHFYTTIPNILTTAANRLFTPGKEYTLSFDYKATANIHVGFRISSSGSEQLRNYVFPITVFPASADWKRASMTVVAPDGTDGEEWAGALGIMSLVSPRVAGDEAYFRKVCLIEGTNTQWVPAASEMVGVDGVGIKSITEYYLATSAGSGVTTGTSGWTTSVQTITATKKYLWNYEVTAYTDGSSTKSSPVVIGVYGDKGATGAKGDKGATGETLSGGKMMFADPTFKSGMNSIEKYSNGTAANKAKLLVERISTSGLADVPTQSGYCIRVTVGAAQSPGHGGVIQGIKSRPGAVFVQKIIAKIPAGYTLESISSQMGTGYKHEFLTSRAGTGKYETYLIKTTCGAAGPFSTGGHIYIEGGSTPTEAAPLVWYIAYMTAFDLTADEEALAVTVDVEPGIIALKTESDGSVVYECNTAKISAKCGSAAASVAYGGAGTLVKTGFSTLGTSVSGGVLTVTLSGVETVKKTAKMPDGKGGTTTKTIMLPVSGGSAVFDVTVTYKNRTETRRVTVPFTVDVKASMSEIVALQDGSVEQIWGSEGMYQQLATLKQTAGELKSTVESMPLGGPNLLPHSMWRAVVRSEAGNTWVKLKKGVKYTLSARACAEEGKDLFVSAYAVQSSGQWGRSNAIRFTEAAFAEKSLTFVLEDKDGFTYNDEVRVLVYAVNVVKDTASATEGKGAVVWVQLEEGPGASAWQAQAGDYEERPSLLKAGDRDLTTTATETETVLEDGTTGTVLYHKMTALEVAVGFADVVRFKANTLTFADPDTQYTISVWAKGTGRIKMYMTANTLGSITQDGAKRIDTDGETEYMELGSTWKRYEATITTDKTVAKNGRVYPLRLFDTGSEVWCYGWKVEKGGMATGGGGASVKYEKELHEYKSDIQQLSDEINLTVKKDDIETAGIHLDGENSTITLRGDRTIIDGDEFNANNATFRNLTVAGNLRTSVVQQPYANDNIFVGKDGDGSLGWMFVHDSGQPSNAKSYVFMPPDPDFIGSRVILHACSAQDSSGTHIATHGMYVLGGRTFCKHAYLEANAGIYYLSRVNAGTGGIRSVAQSVLTGADYFSGKRASVSGGGYYVPNALNNLVGATVELIGAPAFSASAILCPYVVRLGDDMLYNREAPPYVLIDEPLVADPLHAKLKAIYDKDGATAITDLGVGYGVITGATMKYHYSSADSGLMRTKTGLVLFKVPLCQWFISIYNAVSGTFSRASVGTTWENEEWN